MSVDSYNSSETTFLAYMDAGNTGVHNCSDLLNPDLLRSEATWCARISTPELCATVHIARSKHEMRRRGNRNEVVYEKSNVRTCDV